MAALPGHYNARARVGQRFHLPVQYVDPEGTPVDLTGYTITMPIRYQKDGELLFNLIEDEGIIVAPEGWIHISISSTAMTDVPSERFVYDLNLEPPSGDDESFTLLTGVINVGRRVDPE